MKSEKSKLQFQSWYMSHRNQKKARRQPHLVAFVAERLGFVPALPLERSEKPLGENPISNARRQPHSVAFCAERLGFEPRVPVRVRRISSAVHSTTLASLHCFCGCKDTKVNSKFKIYKIKIHRKMSFLFYSFMFRMYTF